MSSRGIPLTAINGGMNRLRVKGAARKDTLYQLTNAYVTAGNTIKPRGGTIRNTDLAATAGAGNTKGLVAHQGALHVFSSKKVAVPAGYVDHVLSHPAVQATYAPPFPGLGLPGWTATVESLLQFEDGGGSTTFTDTGVAAPTWTPGGGAQESVVQAKFGTGSLLCNSSTKYIQTTVASGSAMELITGQPDWTIEFWLYPTTVTAGTAYMLLDLTHNNLGFGRLYFNGPTGMVFQTFGGWAGGGIPGGYPGPGLVANQWNHIALCRDGNILRQFINGAYANVSVATFVNIPAAPSSQNYYVGGSPDSIFGGVQTMYIDGFRITKGVCLYGGTFSQPASALTTTPDAPYTIVTLQHFDDGQGSTAFTDAIGGATWTAQGVAQEVTSQKKFGSGSGAFLNAADDIRHTLTANSSDDLTYDGCDFTYEAFIYPTDVSSGNTHTWFHAAHRASTGLDDTLFYLTSHNTDLILSDKGASINYTAAGALPSAAQWYHVAVVRYGSTWLMFVNGVQVATGGVGGFPPVANGDFWYAGAQGTTGTQSANGYIDEQRIIRGIAVYKGNFTPPAAPYTVPGYTPIDLKEIHFAAPFMGFLYVAAEFVSDGGSGLGTVFHYWLQTSGKWLANTLYQVGQIVSPNVDNGLTYRAERFGAPNPAWAPSTLKAVNDKVEPTVPNGFLYIATVVDGGNPITGTTEPTWPIVDAGVVFEESEKTNTGEVAAPAPQPTLTTPSPGTGGRYINPYVGIVK